MGFNAREGSRCRRTSSSLRHASLLEPSGASPRNGKPAGARNGNVTARNHTLCIGCDKSVTSSYSLHPQKAKALDPNTHKQRLPIPTIAFFAQTTIPLHHVPRPKLSRRSRYQPICVYLSVRGRSEWIRLLCPARCHSQVWDRRTRLVKRYNCATRIASDAQPTHIQGSCLHHEYVHLPTSQYRSRPAVRYTRGAR